MSTGIEWTDETWNPVRGCSRVSPGCEHCYAERIARRFSMPGQLFHGLVNRHGAWSGHIKTMPTKLFEPLSWREPRMVFVNSMSDLFHENLNPHFIAAVFGVMAACPQHTFQILTKRPEAARAWYDWVRQKDFGLEGTAGLLHCCACALDYETEWHLKGDGGPLHTKVGADPAGPWPLPNVWLGTSVEDQERAQERIAILLDTPAAVRFVSAEPLLEPLALTHYLREGKLHTWNSGIEIRGRHEPAGPPGDGYEVRPSPALDWVIVGGESGPQARPCDVTWIEAIVNQCKAEGVPVFVKQLGRNVVEGRRQHRLEHRKGGDPSEWPIALRVRQMPDHTRNTP